mmetsp:Transcript_1635/g.2716  ORF Transcript_1635/g.2716 Transcript_1635/m.2716 type:complete len:358 (+) Transcript_1635:112-1185(+)
MKMKLSSSLRRSKGKSTTTTTTKAASYEGDLKSAIEAVRMASKLCRRSQQQLKQKGVVKKDDSYASPVTVADLGAQAIVCAFLGQSAPVVAEEDTVFLRSEKGTELRNRVVELVNGTLDKPMSESEILDAIDVGRSKGGATGRHWVLDPIDGTRGFVANRQYAIALALLDKGEPVLGVLGCPNLSLENEDLDGGRDSRGGGYLFLAEKERGAFAVGIEDPEEAPRRIAVNEVEAAEAVYMESVESLHSDHAFARKVAETSGIKIEPVRLDSQVKYGVIASGKASAFMRFPDLSYKEWIWDHAAGAIIMSEAGGVVTDSTGKKLDFSKGRILNNETGIVAAPPKLHKKLIESIKALKQ